MAAVPRPVMRQSRTATPRLEAQTMNTVKLNGRHYQCDDGDYQCIIEAALCQWLSED
jgi:hypothetical protein